MDKENGEGQQEEGEELDLPTSDYRGDGEEKVEWNIG
jgi:hypothetical protein